MNALRAYTAEEAAELLHCSPRLMCQMAKSGAIPARKIGKRWLFHESALVAYLNNSQNHSRDGAANEEKFSWPSTEEAVSIGATSAPQVASALNARCARLIAPQRRSCTTN
ncbi:helix-turn-helix domain-containing protein [Microvirgula aerodenitrificans]|uniref:helix-turn-helix domain-containing protein n=1 Tax=Microvirgula aerodenitrificans TaxID=57480 RepID=UPI0036F337D6